MDRPSHDAWDDMIQRCQNPNHKSYERYGGRGITVCAEWHRYKTFADWIYENLGPRPPGMTLDRIDNDGPYAPGNVRWADAVTQRRNRSDYTGVVPNRLEGSTRSEIMKAFWARKKALYPERWGHLDI